MSDETEVQPEVLDRNPFSNNNAETGIVIKVTDEEKGLGSMTITGGGEYLKVLLQMIEVLFSAEINGTVTQTGSLVLDQYDRLMNLIYTYKKTSEGMGL